jgi:hypothetical protein
MVKEHVSRLLLVSVAMHVTVVIPKANRDPLGGAQVTFALEQLSLAVTAKFASASHRPASVANSIECGQDRTGFSRSSTVTPKLHAFVLPLKSFAEQRTVVTPNPNTEPDGGLHVSATPGQLSAAVTL